MTTLSLLKNHMWDKSVVYFIKTLSPLIYSFGFFFFSSKEMVNVFNGRPLGFNKTMLGPSCSLWETLSLISVAEP